MSINSRTLDWIYHLHEEFGIFQDSSVAELGPQDLSRAGGQCSPRSRFPGWTGRHLYLHLGAANYISYDLVDARSVRVDFNSPPPCSSSYDVVTNFGTSEHVFNQAAIMRYIHELSSTGGVMLHVLPSAGGRDHGFFNFHPGFFYDVATANDYEILSFDYLPHYLIQASVDIDSVVVDLAASRKSSRSIEEARIKRALIRLFLNRQVAVLILKLLFRCLRLRSFGPLFDKFVGGDYVHVAFRKRENKPFVMPIQGVYQVRSLAP